LVLLKLINHDYAFNISANRMKTDQEIEQLLMDKIIIDANEQYDPEEGEEEYFEL
jgi:hypothetical protein